MNSKLFFVFSATAAVVAVLSTSFAPSAHAANFAYGSISITPGVAQGFLTYSSLEWKTSQVCDWERLECDPAIKEPPPAIMGEIEKDGYMLSPLGYSAFVQEASKSGSILNKVYEVEDSKLVNPKTIPVKEKIYRFIFTPDGTKAVARTANKIISLDLKNNVISGSAQWNAEDSFSFSKISPDARFVAYYSGAYIGWPTRKFNIVDIVKGKTYTLSEKISYWDLLREENTIFQFSPDSKYLLYKDDRDGTQTLYKVDLASLSKLKGKNFSGKRLFTKNYTVSDFMLLDPNTLIYLANREDVLQFNLYSYDLAKGTLKKILTDASYGAPLKSSGNIVFVNQLVSWGSRVVAYDPITGKIHSLPEPDGSFVSIKQGKEMSFPGGSHGVLFLPDGWNGKTPKKLLIWLHGGPYRQTSLGYHPYASYGVYDSMLENLRSSGIAVLKLDYSGSFGYGRAFAESLQNNVGVKDVKDVLSAISTLKTKYNVSETYLMGVSYGGYLAMRSLVEKPTSFAGAISINGVSDWLTLVNANPNTIFGADFGGPLTEKNEKIYDRASIWAKLPSLSDQKITLLHSTKDSEVSFSQSVKVSDILKKAGKNVEFIRLEEDDHVLKFNRSAAAVCESAFKMLGVLAENKCAF